MTSPHTYHCLCTTLILTTSHPLSSLPIRAPPALDKATVLSLPSGQGHSVLRNVTLERQVIVIRREDGFEKRILLRCQRCELIVGYRLDQAHFEHGHGGVKADEVVYILPGGLMSTEEMNVGKAGKEDGRVLIAQPL